MQDSVVQIFKSMMKTGKVNRLGTSIAFVVVTSGLAWAGKIDPNPRPGFAQALQLLEEGKVEEADALFQNVVESDPEHFDAMLGRAEIALTGKRLEDANRMVSEVLQNRQDLPQAHNMKGLLLLLQKHPAEAREEFLRATELNARYVTPRIYLAVLARQSGDYTGAVAQYKALTQVAPHLPAGYLGQAESLMLLRQPGKAIQILEDWKRADPKSPLPYKVLADIDLADHQPEKARREIETALQKNPHDSATLSAVAATHAELGDMDRAKSEFKQALSANGKNEDAALRLGAIEAGEGQPKEALAHFRQALNADPENVIACNNTAWILAEQGEDLDEALRLAQMATTRDPKYVDGQDTLGWVRYKRGEYAKAISAFQAAGALAPSRADIAAHLKLANFKVSEAREAAQRAIRLRLLEIAAIVILALSSVFAAWYFLKQRRPVPNSTRRAAPNSPGVA